MGSVENMDTKSNMPNIIKLYRRKEDENADLLKSLADMASNGELKGFIFAGFNADRDIVTVALDVNAIDMQTLISYLQVRSVKYMIFGENDNIDM